MKVADLFVNIGVKGADVSGKALGGVKGALSGIADMSLAAKAAILGVVVGLERITGFASQAGMELHKFGVLTGLSTKELQNWQHMGMRFDVDAKEITGTVEGLQAAMTEMSLSGNAPTGLGLLAEKVGFDVSKSKDIMGYVLPQLEKFAKTQPTSVSRNVLKSFGLSDNMVQMLIQVNRERDKIREKDVITPDEIEKLAKINLAWKEIWFSLKTIGEKSVAAFGGPAVEALSNSIKLVIDMASELSELKPALAIIGITIAGVVAALFPAAAPIIALNAAIAGLIALFDQIQKFREGKDNIFTDISNSTKRGFDFLSGKTKPDWAKDKNTNGSSPNSGGFNVGMFAPQIPPKGQAPTTTQNVNIVNNIDGSSMEPKDVTDHIQQNITNAHRQMPAQAGGV